MILMLAIGFGLGVLLTVLAGERDKKRDLIAWVDVFGDKPRTLTIAPWFRK